MFNKNKISATLSAAERDEIIAKIAEIKTKLPFLLNLTTAERSQFRKMGNKGLAYVADCLRAGKAFPSIIPPSIDIVELEKDLTLHNYLSEIAVNIKSLAEGIEDTMTAAGSDAMSNSDDIYAYLKRSAGSDDNIKAQLSQISAHFKKTRKKTEE
ncbi:hypothetical protein GVN16_21155 [Emticicia sp. CRIBPO]|uniref:hypothetical protein n=1 Tax=Emticicia sp. CRIBPO TaxID=2683258 RepID=UPI0014126187|nr:hypothetical protein [Emticicia sp. CRIBPO]NBA88294.1 hypothetical protein [Emticicia sp. CRIBPO]